MRYRANTRLKGAPKHLAPAVLTEAEIQRTAEVLAAWSELVPQPWQEMPQLTQLYWLSEAEMHLMRKRGGNTSEACICCL